MSEEPKFHERVLAVVRRIPRGKVASYGLVGEVAGFPRSARYVARVLRLGKNIPWHRVVGADGSIRIMNPEFRMEQIVRLQMEGVEVGPDGRLDYAKYAWRPKLAKPDDGWEETDRRRRRT